ncbi:MAG TPA: LuxR C-terminal-related transcriptional regulator, partial [Thermomicrobiales bacterium]|nr:LuxR C-terminal-related transcriptional regulator [Thermomicrobiales bacterium]
LGRLAMAEGDPATAAERFAEAAAGYRVIGNRAAAGGLLHCRAAAEALRGDAASAATAWDEAVRLQISVGDRVRLPATLNDMANLARSLHDARLADRLRLLATAVADGATLADADVVDEAAALLARAQTVPAAPAPPRDDASSLSRREREVLRLVAAGRTDREIADALFVSRHTISNHIRHILDKLDVANRAAAVAAATQAGWL